MLIFVMVTHMARDRSSDTIPLIQTTGAPLACSRDTDRVTIQAGIPEDRVKGDSSIFGDFALFGRLYHTKVMLTPIGMFPGALTNMDPREVAIATAMVAPEFVVPVHCDRVGQADYPARFGQHLKTEAPHVQVRILQPGETIEL